MRNSRKALILRSRLVADRGFRVVRAATRGENPGLIEREGPKGWQGISLTSTFDYFMTVARPIG
jgi:hypothetical protein